MTLPWHDTSASPQRRQAPFHRGFLHNRSIGFGIPIDPVQQAVQLIHGAHMQACDKAVLAGDLVAFGELRDRLDLALHLLQFAGQGADAHDGLQQVTEVFGVYVDGVVGQHAAFFQAPLTCAD